MRFMLYRFLTFIILFFTVTYSMAEPANAENFLLCNFDEDISNIGTMDQSSDDPWSALIDVYLDSEGNGTYQHLYVSSGSLESGSFSYSVKKDGQLTILAPGDIPVEHGILSPHRRLTI